MKYFDVAIVGGGLVGASMALSLADSDFSIAVIDPNGMSLPDNEDKSDRRSLALGYLSRQIYERFNLWQDLQSCAEPLERVHVSEQGRLGITRMSASSLGLDALGYVVSLTDLARKLYARLDQQINLEKFSAKVANVRQLPEYVELDIEGAAPIQARLIIIADGGRSRIREKVGITVKTDHYHQAALVCNVTVAEERQAEAFERFAEDGPIALLPIGQSQYALVWTGTEEQTEQRMQLADAEFLAALQQRMGMRLGYFTKAGVRETFPLVQMLAQQLTARRSALIGNAAHILHPVAGQGLNLALRDVAVLASLLQSCEDPGDQAILKAYTDERKSDIQGTALATDALVRLFTRPSFLLSHLRSLGLLSLDKKQFLKKPFAIAGMGYRHSIHLPNLKGDVL